jgi:hypothetical protein
MQAYIQAKGQRERGHLKNSVFAFTGAENTYIRKSLRSRFFTITIISHVHERAKFMTFLYGLILCPWILLTINTQCPLTADILCTYVWKEQKVFLYLHLLIDMTCFRLLMLIFLWALFTIINTFITIILFISLKYTACCLSSVLVCCCM